MKKASAENKISVPNNKRKLSSSSVDQSTVSIRAAKKPTATKIQCPRSSKVADSKITCVPKTKASGGSAVKIALPKISFGGYAISAGLLDSNFLYRVFLAEGDKVNKFLELFEKCLEESCLKNNWYNLLESCFKDIERLHTWFKKRIHKDLCWFDVKSIIVQTFGYQSPKVEAAVIHYINRKQNDENGQNFKRYFDAYRLAARGVYFIDKTKFAQSNIHEKDYLIRNFIDGANYGNVSDTMYNFLSDLYTSKKCNNTLPLPCREHLRNNKRFTDVPTSWIEFEEMVYKELDSLIDNENSAILYRRQKNRETKLKKIGEKKARSNKSTMQQMREEDLIAISILDSNVLTQRRKQKLCFFCGVVKFTHSHRFICRTRKKLLKKARINGKVD